MNEKNIVSIDAVIDRIKIRGYIDCNKYDGYMENYEYDNILYYLEKYKNLQYKIDKAIEFVNSKHNWYGDEEEDNEDYLFELEDFEQLLKILKEDK